MIFVMMDGNFSKSFKIRPVNVTLESEIQFIGECLVTSLKLAENRHGLFCKIRARVFDVYYEESHFSCTIFVDRNLYRLYSSSTLIFQNVPPR